MRKRIWKNLLSILLAALIFTSFATVGLAIEPLELHMEGVFSGDNELWIYCNTNTEQPPGKDEFSVTLGNNTLPVKNAMTLDSVNQAVSYIFLVDASGSIRADQFQAIKDTLTLIGGQLGENDNISIIDIGNETYTQPFVTGSENIQAQIDAIATRGEDTNLYESVTKSLSIFETHEDCHEKKVLVIFSDGEEDNVAGITLDEVVSKIEQSHIPIYTVAMLGLYPAQRYVDSAKVLGSFARLSAGGRHYIHTLDQAANETISDEIVSLVQSSMIVNADLSGFSSDGNEMDLSLELTVSGVGTANDGYSISTAGLSAPPSAEPSTEPSPEPSTEPPAESPTVNEDETDAPNNSLLFWIIGGAAAAILVGIILFFVLRRKKPAAAPPAPQPMPFPRTEAMRPSVPPPPPGKPRISLRLTKIGLAEEAVYHAEFSGQIIIGRSSAKASLAFPKDELLSAAHCSITYEPDGIILRDLGSTNGTFVNGVPVKDRYIFENDDILLIGSMELRVNWEPLSGANRGGKQ
jgi:hypothetical protein